MTNFYKTFILLNSNYTQVYIFNKANVLCFTYKNDKQNTYEKDILHKKNYSLFEENIKLALVECNEFIEHKITDVTFIFDDITNMSKNKNIISILKSVCENIHLHASKIIFISDFIKSIYDSTCYITESKTVLYKNKIENEANVFASIKNTIENKLSLSLNELYEYVHLIEPQVVFFEIYSEMLNAQKCKLTTIINHCCKNHFDEITNKTKNIIINNIPLLMLCKDLYVGLNFITIDDLIINHIIPYTSEINLNYQKNNNIETLVK